MASQLPLRKREYSNRRQNKIDNKNKFNGLWDSKETSNRDKFYNYRSNCGRTSAWAIVDSGAFSCIVGKDTLNKNRKLTGSYYCYTSAPQSVLTGLTRVVKFAPLPQLEDGSDHEADETQVSMEYLYNTQREGTQDAVLQGDARMKTSLPKTFTRTDTALSTEYVMPDRLYCSENDEELASTDALNEEASSLVTYISESDDYLLDISVFWSPILHMLLLQQIFLQAQGFKRQVSVHPPRDERILEVLWRLTGVAYVLCESRRL
eukprot:IDg11445t1